MVDFLICRIASLNGNFIARSICLTVRGIFNFDLLPIYYKLNLLIYINLPATLNLYFFSSLSLLVKILGRFIFFIKLFYQNSTDNTQDTKIFQ